MKQVKWLDQIELSDYYLVGDQSLALNLLIRNKYSVVNGFVIINEVSDSVFRELAIDWSSLNVDIYENLQIFAQKNRQKIIDYDLSNDFQEFLASEVKKLNGKTVNLSYSLVEKNQDYKNLAFLLNRQTLIIDSENILNGIKQIWANLLDAKIIFFCQKKGIKIKDINLTILVQSVDVNSVLVSGYVKNKDNSFVIKSSYGIINSILNGEVLPDIYEIIKQEEILVKKELGRKIVVYETGVTKCLEKKIVDESQQKEYSLNDNNIKDLAELSKSICASFEHDFDIFQWFILKNNRNKVYINQLVNSEKNKIDESEKVSKKEPLLSGLGASHGQIYGKIQVISGFNYHFQAIAPKNILVTKNITPDWLPLLKKAAGIVTEQGGITSHVAIMARELGIPAVVRAKNATKLLKTGESILIDGYTGNIYTDFQEGLENEIIFRNKNQKKIVKNLVNLSTKTKTKLLVNLSEASLIERALKLPIDGIGLIRGDLILLDLISDSHLTLKEWLQPENKLILVTKWADLIIKFCASFTPKSVFYRSLDWLNLNNLQEISPLSSQRGTLNYFNNNSLFELELEVLARVQVAGYFNINLILPFVRSVDEFIFCRNLITKRGLNRHTSFQLLIMAEVPSVIFLLPEYIKAGVQGISIGTNDLTQLLLGIEREKISQDSTLNSIHPAVLKAIETLIKNAKNEGIFTCMCGQAPVEYPELIDYLLHWGIDAISVDLEAVETTHQAIIYGEHKLTLAV